MIMITDPDGNQVYVGEPGLEPVFPILGAVGAVQGAKAIGAMASIGKEALKQQSLRISVDSKKFDYFFGRVVSGSKHNVDRSAQNLKDLTTLGITSEKQLMSVFQEAFKNGRITGKPHVGEHGTTITKSINIGDKGKINVKFFYEGGNMSATPKVTTMIPQIFK